MAQSDQYLRPLVKDSEFDEVVQRGAHWRQKYADTALRVILAQALAAGLDPSPADVARACWAYADAMVAAERDSDVGRRRT